MLPKRLESLSRFLLYVLVFFVPIFFLAIGLDALEIPKQSLVVFLSLASGLAWMGSQLAAKRFAWHRGWLNVFPVLLLAFEFVTAIFSQGPYLSWIGANSEQYASVATTAALVLVYFLVTNLIDTEARRRTMRLLILASAFLAGLWGLGVLAGGVSPAFFPANPIGTFSVLV